MAALRFLLSTCVLLLVTPTESRKGTTAGSLPFDEPSEELQFFTDFEVANVSGGIPANAVKANYGVYYVCYGKIGKVSAWGKCKEEADGTVSAEFVHGRRAKTLEKFDVLVYGDLAKKGKTYIWVKKQDYKDGLVECQPVGKDYYGVVNTYLPEELGDWTVGTWRTDDMAWYPARGWAKSLKEDDYHILCAADRFFSRTRMTTSFLGAAFPKNGVKANHGLFSVCYTCQVEGESQWGECEDRFEGTLDSFVHKGRQSTVDSFQILMQMGKAEKYRYVWVTYSAWASGNAQCQAVIHGDNGPLNVRFLDQAGGWALGSWRWTDLKASIPYGKEAVDVSGQLADSYILCVTTSPGAQCSPTPSPPGDAILELPSKEEIKRVITQHGSEECALNRATDHKRNGWKVSS